MDSDSGHTMDLDSVCVIDSDLECVITPGEQLLSFFLGGLESSIGAACKDGWQFVARWKNSGSGVALAPISLIFSLSMLTEDHLWLQVF